MTIFKKNDKTYTKIAAGLKSAKSAGCSDEGYNKITGYYDNVKYLKLDSNRVPIADKTTDIYEVPDINSDKPWNMIAQIESGGPSLREPTVQVAVYSSYHHHGEP